MSTELSAAEKRRLLRERRQQKFSNGGATDRLNKITGQKESSFLPSKSVLDEKKTKSVPSSSTSEQDAQVDQTTKELDALLSRVPDHRETSPTSGPEANPEVALFQQLLKMQQQGATANGSSPDLDSVDLFSSLLNNDVNTTASASQAVPNFVNDKVLKYYQYKTSTIKAQITLLKWVILTPYVYFIIGSKPGHLPGVLSLVLDRANFFAVFTALEVVFISIYYQLLKRLQRANNVTATQNAGGIVKYLAMIPEGILPVRNIQAKISLALEYLDVLSMYVTDICFVLVMFGIMQYCHRLE